MRKLTALLLAMTFVTSCASSSSDRPPAPQAVPAATTTAPTASTSPVAPAVLTNTAPPTIAAPALSASATAATAAPAPTSPTVTTGAAQPSVTTVLSAKAPSALMARMATEPVGLAKQAVEAETTARNPNATADDRRQAGEQQQLVYRILARHQDWEEAFFTQIPADVEPFARNNYNAAKAPLDPALSRPIPRKDTLPAWSVREAVPADQLLAFYKEGEAKTGIEWVYLAAINMVETRFGRIVGLSTSDAMGPMQFLPTTWNGFCQGDPWDDHDAIVCAARYLKQRGGPASMHRAIQGYNPNDMYEVMVTSYAANLRADPEVLVGYHAWQIFQPTTAGDIRIPVGFRADTPISAADYLASHPADLA